MRTLKFRAWNRNLKNFCEMVITQGSVATKREYISGDLEPWEQFTGLRDKNGVEIYEGDIVEDDFHSKSRAQVIWDDGRYWLEYLSTKDRGSITAYLSELRVIGNIDENPELF